ncbi:hypothetical protein C8J95_10378 [Elizabethkingia sp. YR214]|uniref:hypothetical protein n=1 Tax=Elizabethkingia sp. YR214 TaxID=2135667 RepID=UPI000D327122|nr:hypothetical protein [Elizabethkingia sp. YR214]PUB33486.1 hypothetical protein C8J95_10378 [Elizabethkingia sp. YR214]
MISNHHFKNKKQSALEAFQLLIWNAYVQKVCQPDTEIVDGDNFKDLSYDKKIIAVLQWIKQ